jgi:hypothetical protein
MPDGDAAFVDQGNDGRWNNQSSGATRVDIEFEPLSDIALSCDPIIDIGGLAFESKDLHAVDRWDLHARGMRHEAGEQDVDQKPSLLTYYDVCRVDLGPDSDAALSVGPLAQSADREQDKDRADLHGAASGEAWSS